MPMEFHDHAEGKVLIVKASGELTRVDYERVVSETKRLVQRHGKIRILLEMHDFHGREVDVLWDSVTFDPKHFGGIQRLAVVGDREWEHAITSICKPFARAAVCCFDRSQTDQAREWIEAGLLHDRGGKLSRSTAESSGEAGVKPSVTTFSRNALSLREAIR